MLIKANGHSPAHLKMQLELLESAARAEQPLSDALAKAGWSYDDLIYENSMTKKCGSGEPPSLDDWRTDSHRTPLVSFFSGCGGMDLGFETAGFEHIAAFELNEIFCKTLRQNRPEWRVFGPPTHCGDVSQIDQVLETLGSLLRVPFDGAFVGGPPCQSFSIAANQRFAKWGDNFKRTGFSHETNGNLLFDFLNLVIAFRPKAFAIENVPGLRDLDGGEQLRLAIKKLKRAGYQVEEPFVIDAAQYRVPQQRWRLFVVGSRDRGAFKHPERSRSIVGAGSVLNGGKPNLPNNETREHKAESIIRYMQLDYGQRDHLGRVDRLDPTLPSKTVIAGGTNGGGRSHLHPEIPRTLSVRECARLQTFPDDFIFVGASARQFTQVGNALPPVLAAQIAHSLHESYF